MIASSTRVSSDRGPRASRRSFRRRCLWHHRFRGAGFDRSAPPVAAVERHAADLGEGRVTALTAVPARTGRGRSAGALGEALPTSGRAVDAAAVRRAAAARRGVDAARPRNGLRRGPARSRCRRASAAQWRTQPRTGPEWPRDGAGPESVVDAEPEDYDPWEPYNERMFAFNHNIDRYVLKPAANVYRHIVPEPFQLMIANGFDNIRYPARLVNHLLQGRFWGAFIETSRFVINSTMGIGRPLQSGHRLLRHPEVARRLRPDAPSTGAWGPGRYFVPPFLPPATVRDFIGRLADSAINPISWFLLDFWPEGLGIGMGDMLNDRALNYELFQGFEETTLDLYSAVRHGYLRRRERQRRLDRGVAPWAGRPPSSPRP